MISGKQIIVVYLTRLHTIRAFVDHAKAKVEVISICYIYIEYEVIMVSITIVLGICIPSPCEKITVAFPCFVVAEYQQPGLSALASIETSSAVSF